MSDASKKPHCSTCDPANQEAEVRRLANGTLDASTLKRSEAELLAEAATTSAGERYHLEARARFCALAGDVLFKRARDEARPKTGPLKTIEELRALYPAPPPLSPEEDVRSILEGFLNLVPLLLVPEPKQGTVSSVKDLLARAKEALTSSPLSAYPPLPPLLKDLLCSAPHGLRAGFLLQSEDGALAERLRARWAARQFPAERAALVAGCEPLGAGETQQVLGGDSPAEPESSTEVPQETVSAFAARARKALLEKRDSLDGNTNAGQRGRRGGLEEAASIIHTLASTTP